MSEDYADPREKIQVSLDTGLSFPASLADLEELGRKINELSWQAREHQNKVRAGMADLSQYGLVYHNKPDVWTLPNALGKYPYGVPLLKYNGASNLFRQDKTYRKEHLYDRWHFTLSTKRQRQIASAKYDDREAIEKLVELLYTADPETMAIQFALQDKTDKYAYWEGEEKVSSGNEKETAEHILRNSRNMPSIPEDLFSKLILEGLKPSTVGIIDPALYRIVALEGWIYVGSEGARTIRNVDRILSKHGYMGLACTRKTRGFYYQERYAVPAGFRKKIGSLTDDALNLLTLVLNDDNDLFSFVAAETRGVIDFTALTYEERNLLIKQVSI